MTNAIDTGTTFKEHVIRVMQSFHTARMAIAKKFVEENTESIKQGILHAAGTGGCTTYYFWFDDNNSGRLRENISAIPEIVNLLRRNKEFSFMGIVFDRVTHYDTGTTKRYYIRFEWDNLLEPPVS